MTASDWIILALSIDLVLALVALYLERKRTMSVLLDAVARVEAKVAASAAELAAADQVKADLASAVAENGQLQAERDEAVARLNALAPQA